MRSLCSKREHDEAMSRHLHEALRIAWNLASHEWLLTGLRWANGGDVILLRSLAAAGEIYALALFIRNGLDPRHAWPTGLAPIRTEILATASWFGPIFAGVYASLFARYSSQWNYLAGVYNKIKETEARGAPSEPAMAQWKAAFIEDADDLHLTEKPMFASTIFAWGSEPLVHEQFVEHTIHGSARWEDIMGRVSRKIGKPLTAPRASSGTTRDDVVA
jgi:hypothetical protein